MGSNNRTNEEKTLSLFDLICQNWTKFKQNPLLLPSPVSAPSVTYRKWNGLNLAMCKRTKTKRKLGHSDVLKIKNSQRNRERHGHYYSKWASIWRSRALDWVDCRRIDRWNCPRRRILRGRIENRWHIGYRPPRRSLPRYSSIPPR